MRALFRGSRLIGLKLMLVVVVVAVLSSRRGEAWSCPGSVWRGGPDTPAGQVSAAMLARIQRADEALGFKLEGDSVESVFRRAVLDNPRVTNEQLLAISRVTLEQLATSPEDRVKVLKKIPEARRLPVHRFAVALVAGATGLDPQALSGAAPDLGLAGSADMPLLLWAPKSEREQRFTALHDFTDYLRAAGVQGLNEAVWGVESRELSAIVGWLEFGSIGSNWPHCIACGSPSATVLSTKVSR